MNLDDYYKRNKRDENDLIKKAEDRAVLIKKGDNTQTHVKMQATKAQALATKLNHAATTAKTVQRRIKTVRNAWTSIANNLKKKPMPRKLAVKMADPAAGIDIHSKVTEIKNKVIGDRKKFSNIVEGIQKIYDDKTLDGEVKKDLKDETHDKNLLLKANDILKGQQVFTEKHRGKHTLNFSNEGLKAIQMASTKLTKGQE